jgi:hypothetical protein
MDTRSPVRGQGKRPLAQEEELSCAPIGATQFRVRIWIKVAVRSNGVNRTSVPRNANFRTLDRTHESRGRMVCVPAAVPTARMELRDQFHCFLEGGSGGERGIRTPDRAFQPYNGLANRRLQPLGHLSGGDVSPVYRKCGVPAARKKSGGNKGVQGMWARGGQAASQKSRLFVTGRRRGTDDDGIQAWCG